MSNAIKSTFIILLCSLGLMACNNVRHPGHVSTSATIHIGGGHGYNRGHRYYRPHRYVRPRAHYRPYRGYRGHHRPVRGQHIRPYKPVRGHHTRPHKPVRGHNVRNHNIKNNRPHRGNDRNQRPHRKERDRKHG